MVFVANIKSEILAYVFLKNLVHTVDENSAKPFMLMQKLLNFTDKLKTASIVKMQF